MTTAQICIFVTIIVYLLAVLGIGIYCSKENNSTDDFYLGGRKLGPIVTAMSAEASDMSSWLLMGLPGVAYLTGLADATWTAIGLAIGTYINWLIVSKRIRRYTEVAGNSITIPDFFSRRYHDDKNILMCIAAIVIIIFFIPYTASGFAACGKLFSSLFGIDYFWAMIISAVVIVGYTALGGFLAASTTDFIQSIIMTVALIVVLAFGINQAGGMDAVINNAKDLSGYLSLVKIHNTKTLGADNYSLISIVSTLAWGLGYFGMPHILLRFMAIEDDKKLSTSRRVASIWVVISLAVAVFIGVVGNGMTKAGAIGELSNSNSETIIVRIADLLSQNGIFFAIIAGVILAGILASTMSTADSQLLAASSSVSHNLFVGLFKKELSQKTALIVARISVIIIAIIAIFIARDPNSSVFNIVSFAWAGFGAAFGPIVLFALFWRRSNKYGALAGMVSGGIMVFVWKYLIRPFGGAFDIYELLPAFIVASIFIVVVSLLTEEPSEEITKEFDEVANSFK
ncbi:sodium/proline symporter PutP [Clostridium sp. MSJ-8]|uniref:sodium/proline symporter PutP n=1 Tax=Clostridium sp. MSJ-8 TaxID=2841510 RepID=UPI001C0F3316|nr:sodium/proline symporter PutP [Clostridium sp. MSJ-8]MBU5486937.1 sodium/proline symporter PutP [Clostridium sp. MSJ-8]